MLRYHMAVVTKDNALKRALKRLTTAMASTADFSTDAASFGTAVEGGGAAKHPNLVIVDARGQAGPDKALLAKIPKDSKILYIIEEDSLAQKLILFRDERVTSLFCYDAQFDDEEFISSATKALRGEVFGLQKYFPWGVTSFSMRIQNHDEKERALEVLLEFANLAGVRGGVRDRIQIVCDELMMNAMYHAPVDSKGEELYANRSLKELAQLEKVNTVQVQYGCSGRYFGVSVRDASGSLKRFRLLDYLLRAAGKTSEIETKAGGAGLGLVSVVKSVSKLVFNIEPKSSTEVIALFDMELFAKGKMGARSLHMFLAPEKVKVADDEVDDEGDRPQFASVKPRTWIFAAVLLAIATGLGTAVAMKKSADPGSSKGVENCAPAPGAPGATTSAKPR